MFLFCFRKTIFEAGNYSLIEAVKCTTAFRIKLQLTRHFFISQTQ